MRYCFTSNYCSEMNDRALFEKYLTFFNVPDPVDLKEGSDLEAYVDIKNQEELRAVQKNIHEYLRGIKKEGIFHNPDFIISFYDAEGNADKQLILYDYYNEN